MSFNPFHKIPHKNELNPWVGICPGEGNDNQLPVSTPVSGKSHGQRSLVDYSPWGCKGLDMTESVHTHTHRYTYSSNSNILHSTFQFDLDFL